jgi:hypothetical protein
MKNSENRQTMTNGDRGVYESVGTHDDQIGKVFVVRSHGLRQCLVCGEFFTRSTAPEHATVDCYPSLDLLPLSHHSIVVTEGYNSRRSYL